MEQPDRPPDASLVLSRRPLHVRPVPEAEPIGLSFWGFLQYRPDAFSDTYNVVLGVRYTLQELDAFYLQASHAVDRASRGFIDPAPDPDDERLMRLLMMNAADRRMTYRAQLAVEIRAAEQASFDEMKLDLERKYWERLDFIEMDDRLAPGLEHRSLREHMKDVNDCWLWVLPLEKKYPHPTVPSWRQMKHVNVHRLLWPLLRPDEPFTLGTRPVRNNDLCWHTTCVNPRHFLDPTKRTKVRVQGPGRGFAGAFPSPNRIKWDAGDVHVLDNGIRRLLCPRCKEPAGPRYQELVNLPEGVWPRGGVMYCANCYQLYKQAMAMFTKNRVTRLPNLKRGETAAERFERAQRDDDWPEWSRPVEREREPEPEALPPGLTPGWGDYDLDEAMKHRDSPDDTA